MTKNPLLNNLLAYFFFKCFILIFLIVLIFIAIKFLKNKKGNLYRYKIFDFDLNNCCVIIYCILFFVLILITRIKNMYMTIHLSEIQEKFANLNANFSWVNLLFFYSFVLLGFILFIIIIIKIYQLLLDEVKKKYLVYSYNYSAFFYYIEYIFSLDFVLRQLYNIFLFFLIYLQKNKKISERRLIALNYYILLLSRFLIYHIPIIVFFIYFLFELRQGLIHDSFYFLPFFFIYMSLRQYSIYIKYNNFFFNGIIFNMYYHERTIAYVNLPSSYEDCIYQYIDNGLQLTFNFPENFVLYIQKNFFYVTPDNGKYYFSSSGEYFIEEFNNRQDIFPYVISSVDIEKLKKFKALVIAQNKKHYE